VDRERKVKEILEFFDRHPSLEGGYYYRALFNEHQKVEDPLNGPEIIELLQTGVEKEADPACAAKLLFAHIEPSRLNGGLPDYDCEEGIRGVLEVFKRKGIFEYCDDRSKRMPLVQAVMNFMDLSTVLRDFLQKR
jgi:hypothetical protein